jgi:hypothetical protein
MAPTISRNTTGCLARRVAVRTSRQWDIAPTRAVAASPRTLTKTEQPSPDAYDAAS